MINLNCKKVIISFFAIALFSVSSFAQNYPLKYSSDIVSNGLGEDHSAKTYELGAAIKLDAAKIKPFLGGKIAAIKVGTISEPSEGAITTAKDLKIFIRTSLEGENLYEQKVSAFSLDNLGGWYDVVLDKPFDLDGQEIYVGYSLTANSIPLGFDGSKTPDPRATWVGVNNEWISYSDGGNACIQAMVSNDKLVPRKVLLEHFTTAACVSCPAVHTMLEGLVGNNKDVVWVAHHSGYSTDEYTTEIDNQYLSFFEDAPYAPAIMYDRVNMSGYGAISNNQAQTKGPVFFPGTRALAEGLLGIRTSLPSFVSVDMDGTYDSESRKLTVTVHGNTIAELMGLNPTINLFLTEDGLISSQSGAGNKYIHNHVFRAAITGAWGETLKLESDGSYSKTYEYTLNTKWASENMNVVAFIGNVNTKNMNDCEVYNAKTIKLADSFTGINTNKDDKVALYVNGSLITIDGTYSSASIYDYAGKLLKTLNSNEHSFQMEKGIYLVKIISEEQITTKKIAVK